MRGVNVGSAKRFQPSLLARDLEHLGVSNLGAAGTFVVRGAIGQAALRAEFLRRAAVRLRPHGVRGTGPPEARRG